MIEISALVSPALRLSWNKRCSHCSRWSDGLKPNVIIAGKNGGGAERKSIRACATTVLVSLATYMYLSTSKAQFESLYCS